MKIVFDLKLFTPEKSFFPILIPITQKSGRRNKNIFVNIFCYTQKFKLKNLKILNYILYTTLHIYYQYYL